MLRVNAKLLMSALAWLVLLQPIGALADGALPEVRIFAHRGFHLHAPENSLASLEAARKLGLAGSEVDVRMTKDCQLVLMHDEELSRTTNGHGLASEHTLAQLNKLHLKNPDGRLGQERIATLARALDWLKRSDAPPFTLVLDLKQADPVAAGRLVLTRDLADQVVFFIDQPHKVDEVRAIQALDPKLQVSVDLLGWWKIEGLPGFTARALDVGALFASEWFFPRCGFAEAKEAGAEVMVFLWGEHDLAKRLRRAVSLGAQVISSDRPDLLLKDLKNSRPAHAKEKQP